MAVSTSKGTLTLSIERANDLKNEDTFGLSDPYCEFKIESNGIQIFEGRTPTVDDNLNPKWGVRFTRRIEVANQVSIKFTVMDEDVGDPDFLGAYEYNFQPQNNFEQHLTVTLTDKKGVPGKRGTLTFRVFFAEERPLTKSVHDNKLDLPGARSGNILCGPILLFRNAPDQHPTYAVDILILIDKDETPDFTVAPAPINYPRFTKILEWYGKYLWKVNLEFPRLEHRVCVEYRFLRTEHQFNIPALNEPLRFVVVSCNGYHEEPVGFTKPKFALWKHCMQRHENEVNGYHIIINGGDQVYADPVWKLDFIKDLEPGHPGGATRAVSAEFKEEIEHYYMNLYMTSWGGSTDLSQAYASIPSVMMWDDHDIFDGWGSYPEELMSSELYESIGSIAEKYFCAFQLGSTVEEVRYKKLISSMPGSSKGYSQMYKIDKTGIACLDLRKERTMKQVCTQETYADFVEWIHRNRDQMDHLLLVLSIPIVYNDFDVLEKAIASTGLGEELKDDLQDHWRTEDHRQERLILLKLLLKEAIEGKFRITILSGDVHISCAGVIYDKQASKTSNAAIINSLISSAVVNIPPPPAVIQILELTGSEIEIVEKTADNEIKAGLYRLLGDHRQFRYFGGRNYLELIQNCSGGTNASWFVEGHEHEAFQLYIYPFKAIPSRDKTNITEKIHREIRLRTDDFKYIGNSITTLLTLPFSTITGWFS